MDIPKTKTRWHRLLGKMLEELLTPVDITVITEFKIMNDPPEADILLLGRDLPQWSDEQLKRLPDGIRDTAADHILIEFKYTESVNREALSQALAYDTFYRRTQKLPPDRIQTFVLSSRTPGKSFTEAFGYAEKERQGVYHSTHSMLDYLPILSLNDLADEPYNQFIKCFASRKKEKERAFKKTLKSGKSLLNFQLQWLITGLWKTYLNQGENIMETELTPEKVMEIGKLWGDAYFEAYLDSLPVEKRLAGLKPEDRMAGLKPEDILAGLKPEEIKDIETYLKKLKGKKSRKK